MTAQHPAIMHFGLGDLTKVKRLKVVQLNGILLQVKKRPPGNIISWNQTV